MNLSQLLYSFQEIGLRSSVLNQLSWVQISLGVAFLPLELRNSLVSLSLKTSWWVESINGNSLERFLIY